MHRETMDLSEIRRASIIGQGVVNDRLVTEFRGTEYHAGGTLVCEPVESKDQTEDAYSDSVTRFGLHFWSKGTFTPRPDACGYYCSEDVGHVDHVR
jgi:hypothetical protein